MALTTVDLDTVTQAMLVIALIVAVAKLGGELAVRLRQPPVLGELLAGVAMGNLGLLGFGGLEPLKHSEPLAVLAEIGAVLLLFEVGVESDLGELLAVGWSSLLVATLGVVAPMALGYWASVWMLPDASWLTHLFIAGTLTATSVGITARVLKDLGQAATREARIILGAAVADDVMGLMVMAVVSGLAAAMSKGSGSPDMAGTALIIGKAVGFLAFAVVVGRLWSQRAFGWASQLRVPGALIGLCICFCFGMASLASLAGLAPIVGAFCAGVVLDKVHYKEFSDRGEPKVEELLEPITALVVPVFFVLMGLHVDLRGFAEPGVLGLAGLITLVAVIGKQVCGLGVVDKGVDRLAVGIGMIPRGEVGLIFASLGTTVLIAGKPAVSGQVFSALVLMVILTTLMTPPLLKFAFGRKK